MPVLAHVHPGVEIDVNIVHSEGGGKFSTLKEAVGRKIEIEFGIMYLPI